MNNAPLRIHIVGASGSGTTSLGRVLSEKLQIIHLDTDDFYWHVKYSEKVPIPERLETLKISLDANDSWILSGSLVSWGGPLIPLFDLVIFLYVPKDIRISRLEKREKERYGDDILSGNRRHKEYQQFIEWNASYDTAGLEIRSLKMHETWLESLSCPVLRYNNVVRMEELVEKVMSDIRQILRID